MDALVHRGLSFLRALHPQQLDERLYRDALQEHREVNHSDGGGHEDRLRRHPILVDEQHQGEGDSASQSTVGHDELIDVGQFVDAEAVGDPREQNDADDAEKGAEEDGEDNEPGVPVVVRFDGRHAEEHENDRLRRTGKHLQRVLYCRVRLVRNIRLHVVLHRDAAECDTERSWNNK